MQYSGVLIKTTDNKLLLQQRDHTFGIVNPGKLAIFGGSVEEDESFEDCAIREIREEVGLVVKNTQLKILGIYYDQIPNIGEVESYIFLVEDVDRTKLVLTEGESIFELDPSEDLTNLNLTTLCRHALTDFLKN
ncbi:MAG: NUDIX domain-containing protein [Candidatus Levybacteria bacterium]|nr:NUDIX domain-containing protein [Candidatus Levybacteria bacterium]